MSGRGKKQQSGIVPGTIGYQDMCGRITRYPLRGTEKTSGGAQRDVAARPSLDGRDGCRLFLPFPDRHAESRPASGRGMEVDLCRAYNRWLSEQILPETGGRFSSMLYLPFSDPDASHRHVENSAITRAFRAS